MASGVKTTLPPKNSAVCHTLSKVLTGIDGFDQITQGGLPKGRPSLICGSAGCGKTLFAMEFLIRGAIKFGEHGVFFSFEEREKDLLENTASFDFHLNQLRAQKKIALDYIHIERNAVEETGAYDLEGLFVRLEYAINSIGAKRVVLDTIENLFLGLSNHAILRAELRRLFQWLKDKGVTAVITGERGNGQLTRHGLEEYVSDCVILLDQRLLGQVSTRTLRVVKYRGSSHGTNEYPFLIGDDGINVMPITSMGLDQTVSSERISTGIKGLDNMLGGKGVFKGTSILVSGTPGNGKTSVAAYFADATCRRGDKCLYFAFEESEAQIVRNMKSINLDLGKWLKKGALMIHATRPAKHGLEAHLAIMNKLIQDFKPSTVIVDPISNLISAGTQAEAEAMLLRLVDHLKSLKINTLLTSLSAVDQLERSEARISSLMDTWILLKNIEHHGERNRGIAVLKSRGMFHSNKVREFLITGHGIELVDVYQGEEGSLEGILLGSERIAHQTQGASSKIKSPDRAKKHKRKDELSNDPPAA